jgi:tRNA-2-methylthio-N6-dimethylallyladenosine synthase
MAETPAVMPHLHLPLQSGSARVLRAMQRGYTPQRFLDRLAMMRAAVPGLAVTTDIIVGFPGETEADFKATLAVVEEAAFDGAFMFVYSPRPGTPAAAMDGRVDPAAAAERFARLADLQQRLSLARNQELVGQEVEVLAEGPSRKDPSMATARTRTNKVVHLPGTFPPGTFLQARLERAAPSHLMGRVVL